MTTPSNEPTPTPAMSANQTSPAMAALANEIVVELLEYDNMDFNDEEQHYHDRRVRFVTDSLTAHFQTMLKDSARFQWLIEHCTTRTFQELSYYPQESRAQIDALMNPTPTTK